MRRSADRRGLFCALSAALVSAISRSRMGAFLSRGKSCMPGRAGLQAASRQRRRWRAINPNPGRTWRLTGRLVLADGTVIAGQGLGATGSAVGEVCFNTAMTGYQEILTDPSYAGQIITFTFPHIGNVGANREDTETSNLAMRSGVRGCVLRAEVTAALQLSRRRDSRCVAEGARHHRHHRRRHARADRPHPREGHAQRRHRPRAVGQVRSRQARRPRPRPGRGCWGSTWCRR